MAKEHEKIPKVKNAPRQIHSQSSMGTLFAPLLGLVLVLRGRGGSVIPEGKGQSSEPRRCFGPCHFPHRKGCVCTAHLQGEWEGWSGKLDIDNFQNPHQGRSTRSPRRRQTLAAETFPGWHGSVAPNELTPKPDILRMFHWSDVSPSLARAIMSKSRGLGCNKERFCLWLFPLGITVEGEGGKAFSRALIHQFPLGAPQEGETLGCCEGKVLGDTPGMEQSQHRYIQLSTLGFCHF